MAQREVEALTQAKAVKVPRVPELREHFEYSAGDQHLILEYLTALHFCLKPSTESLPLALTKLCYAYRFVDGESVSRYLKYRAKNKYDQPEAEARMVTAAVQLFEVNEDLQAHICQRQ